MVIWVYEVIWGYFWWCVLLMVLVWVFGLFCFIFFVGVFYGGDLVWVNCMIIYFVLMVGMVLIMLVFYFFLKVFIWLVKGIGYVLDWVKFCGIICLYFWEEMFFLIDECWVFSWFRVGWVLLFWWGLFFE